MIEEIKQSLVEVVEAAWLASLELEIEEAASRNGDEGVVPGHRAVVQFSGTWEGALILDCTEDSARLAAASMFSVAPRDATTEDQRDCLGELANIVAGNLRGLLTPNGKISLPTVIMESEASTQSQSGTILERVFFTCAGFFLCFTLLETGLRR